MSDTIILILSLVLSGISLASAVVSVWASRKNNVRELENDVSEIASIVEKVYRESRRQQMRRVRQGSEGSDFEKPPGLIENPAPNAPLTKADLRRMIATRNPQ